MTSFLRMLTLFFCGFMTCSVLFAEEKYPEFTLPDISDRKEFEEKFDELFTIMRRTTWGSFRHEFSSDAEKDAYRRRLYAEIIKGCDDFIAVMKPDEIRPVYLYRIAVTYREFYNNVPDEEKPRVLEELKNSLRKYENTEAFKAAIADVKQAILVFPYALEVVDRNTTEFIERPVPVQKDFLERFYTFLETHRFSSDTYTMELVDDILYGTLCFLEKLAADDPSEKQYAIDMLKKYTALLQEKFSRGKTMGKVVERLEMQGKPCPWKLPVFGSDEVVDFTTKKGRVSLITFFPVYRPETLYLQYAERLWKDKGLDIYNVDHRYSAYIRELMPVIGLDWPVFQQIPLDVPDRGDYYFLKRYLGVDEAESICILIGKDGIVIDSNLLQKNVVAELEKLFDPAPYDIKKKADVFIQKVSDGKLLELTKGVAPEDLPQLLADVSLVAYRNSGGANLSYGDELIELAMKVYEKSESGLGKEKAVDTIVYFTTWFENFGKEKNEKLAEILERLDADKQPRLADKVRWARYKLKFQYEMKQEDFIKLRDELFTYLLEHPDSVVPDDLYPLLCQVADVANYFSYSPETQKIAAETFLACSKMLAGSRDPEIVKQVEFLYGQARRLMLVGNEMPLDGVMLDGTPLDPVKYYGKVVLVDFWATWCGYCIEEFPKVKKLYEKYHDRGFEVVGISTDRSISELEEYLAKNKLPWDCFVELKLEELGRKRMDVRYGVTGIPQMILIGRDGKVISIEARGETLEKELAKLFPEEN